MIGGGWLLLVRCAHPDKELSGLPERHRCAARNGYRRQAAPSPGARRLPRKKDGPRSAIAGYRLRLEVAEAEDDSGGGEEGAVDGGEEKEG